MKALLATVGLLSLCACTSSGPYRTTTTIDGQTVETIDLTSPQFYMDEDDLAPYSPDAPDPSTGYCPACP